MNEKIRKGEYLEVLLRSPITLFSTKDIALIWGESSNNTTRVRLNKYVKNKKLIHVRRGFYAKDSNYNFFEAATKIYTPSYISFETVLASEGVVFQSYQSVFVASYVSRDISVNGRKISFKKMKYYVLTNTAGIISKDGYSIATKERAFLDTIYINKSYYFDNLNTIDWNTVFELLPMYNNKKMEKTVKKYFEEYNLSKK